MKLVINASNIHQGGGRTLLLALLAAIRGPTIVFLDARLKLAEPLLGHIQAIVVEPSLAARFAVERQLPSLCEPGDILVAFGNLPPLFASPARVFVYLQNRYLTAQRPLAGLPLRARTRIHVERLWLRLCLRDATVLVQTQTTAAEVKANLGVQAVVAPFAPALPGITPTTTGPSHDFLYVASGEPHKNHLRLVEAWEILAAGGCYPSLRLTLDPARDADLLHDVETRTTAARLKISNTPVSLEGMPALYAEAKALVYPSAFESFGLPLIEAHRAGLEIVAAERDYVRDVVAPAETFDPDSALSIARAVRRQLRFDVVDQPIPSAEEFLANLFAAN